MRLQRRTGRNAAPNAENGCSNSGAQESGWENMKSPRKTMLHVIALACFVTAVLVYPANLAAQDPPSAPVPKVPKDAPASPPAAAQDGQIPANQQNPSDSQTTLKFAVNYVFLPVTVKDSNGPLVPDLTRNE